MQEITLYLTHISKIDRVNKSVNAGEVTKHQNKYLMYIYDIIDIFKQIC